MRMGGTDFFTEVKTIANEPACHHCHGKSKPILGALITRQNLSQQFGALRLSQLLAAGLSLAGMVALSFVLFSFIKRTVIARVDSIERSADEVIRGNLNASFKVEGEDRLAVLAEHLGTMVGALPEVTHCYRRPRHLPQWPYNLFAMVHGATREEVQAQAEHIAALLGAHCRGHDILFSTRILKKTGLRLRG